MDVAWLSERGKGFLSRPPLSFLLFFPLSSSYHSSGWLASLAHWLLRLGGGGGGGRGGRLFGGGQFSLEEMSDDLEEKEEEEEEEEEKKRKRVAEGEISPIPKPPQRKKTTCVRKVTSTHIGS